MNEDGDNRVYFDNLIPGKVLSVDFFNKHVSIKPSTRSRIDQHEAIYGRPETDVQEYLDLIRSNQQNLILGIVTTFNCNLSCVYCYQKKFQDENCSLTKNMCRDICNYILKYIEYYKSNTVKLIFTGGEPTLKIDSILEITNYLKLICDRRNIRFTFSIVTNGTIDISNHFMNLKKLGMDLIQVSLDGSRQIHNTRRVSNFDAYDKTIRFIKKCSDSRIKTVIRINVDEGNISELDNMLMEIEGFVNKSIILSLYPTEKTLCERTIGSEEKFEIDNMLKAHELARKYGFQVANPNPFFAGCMSLVPIGQYIDPAGNVYKCGGMLGHKEEIVGSIYDFDNTTKNTYSYIDKKLNGECMECKLFPVCAGGCIYNKHYTKGCNEIFKEQIYEKAKLRILLYLIDKKILKFSGENEK